MRLGYWTLGMPPWSYAEFARAAVELGYDGVGLRTEKRNGSEAHGAVIPLDADDAALAAIRRSFDDAGIEISSLVGYNAWVFADGREDWDAYESDIARHAALAARLGVGRMRVGLDLHAGVSDVDAYLDLAWERIGRALDGAPGVHAAIENHPGRAGAEQLLSAAERSGDPRVGVVYSPDHALVMQEDVLGLVRRFPEQIHEVSLADRRLVREGLADFDGRYYEIRYEMCAVGEGDVPVAELLEELERVGFDAYVSLKWEKSPSYGQHLQPGDVVLPEFARLLRSYPQFRDG